MPRSRIRIKKRTANAQPLWRHAARVGASARRGLAAFVLVFGIAMLITVTGLTLVAVRRSEGRIQSNMLRSTQAQYVALAGVEYALERMKTVTNWRSTLNNGSWYDMAFGRGRFVVEGTDTDGNLANNATDPVTITSTGTVDGAVSKVRVTLTPRRHRALRYGCFAATTLDLKVCSVKGPVRSNGNITADNGTMTSGNTYYETMVGNTIDLRLQPARLADTIIPYPRPVLANYLAMATPITGNVSFYTSLTNYVLTPTRNSESPGNVNANGIYSLNAGGKEVYLDRCHIKGTLIIYNTSQKVSIQNSVWIEPSGYSYPSMLIYTNGADVEFILDRASLSEPLDHVDYNLDGDQGDSLASSVSGVLWTQNSYVFIHKNYSNFRGCVIGYTVRVDESASLDEDPALAQAYMPGFIDTDMQVVQGSWREVQP